MDNNMPLMLASPELSNLQEVEQVIRMANSSPGGRDALTKYIVGADYVTKLVPLVEVAEEFESLADLHRLCNIMKMLILLNDTAIIEHAVSDDVVMGVVGALECKAGPARGLSYSLAHITSQMTLTSRVTKRTTDNTSRTSRSSRKSSA